MKPWFFLCLLVARLSPIEAAGDDEAAFGDHRWDPSGVVKGTVIGGIILFVS